MTECRISAVIFDMDGLVLDSEIGYVHAWRRAAAEMDCELADDFCLSLSGIPGQQVSQRIQAYCGNDFNIDRFQRLSGSYWTAYVEKYGIAVKPGFFALMAVLLERSLPYCLATNSRLAAAQRCLALAGLQQTFPHIVAGDAVAAAKPAPDIFWRAAAELACPIQECLVLEDSSTGVAAALAAGAPCILVPSLRPVDAWAAEHADYLMDDLGQVADFISARPDHPL